MIHEIKSWETGKVIYSAESDSLLKLVEMAVIAHANLVRANLYGANLYGANLYGANLVRANLVRANLDGANLVRANLYGANLYGANLVRANLVRANLDENTKLETGETWKQYLEEVLPALLTAGGKPLESFTEAWQCHSWDNCPMAHAFDVKKEEQTPILLRPRVRQFVRLFDAKLIPWPLPVKETV